MPQASINQSEIEVMFTNFVISYTGPPQIVDLDKASGFCGPTVVVPEAGILGPGGSHLEAFGKNKQYPFLKLG